METQESPNDRIITIPDWLFECLEDPTPNRTFWITKGLGAGGTYGLALWHLFQCFFNDRSEFSWSVAPTYQQVVDTLIPAFANALEGVFFWNEGIDYEIITSGRPRIILNKTNQEIHFRSANKAERMVGANISHLSGTEPGLWPLIAFEKSSARVRCPNANRRQSLFEGTPEGLGNPYEQFANFNEGVSLERNARRVIIHTEDNPHLPEDYVKRLENTYKYDPAKLEAYLYGRFVSFQKGSAYWEFRDSQHVKLGLQASETLPLIFAWDFNKSPLAWVVMQRKPVERNWVRWHQFEILKESSGESRGILDACGEFIANFPPSAWNNTRVEVYGDPSGFAGSHLSPDCAFDQIYKALSSRYREVIILADRSAPSVQSRLEKHNQLLAYKRVLVDAACINTIRSHNQTNLKKGMWQIEKPAQEDWTHYADALGYALYQITRGENLEAPEQQKVYGITV